MDIKEELMLVGERIRVFRRRRKLTQTELGKQIGYSMNGIAKIEQGNSDPKFSSLLKIAGALGVDVENLVGDRLTSARESDLSQLTDQGLLEFGVGVLAGIRELSQHIDASNAEIIRRGIERPVVEDQAKRG